MSVYFESLQSGRLHTVDYAVRGGARRALKAAKRREAEERNSRTPYERTRQYRREIAERDARIAAKKAEKKAARERVRHG